MTESRMDAAFETLKIQVPHAPQPLVERMVRTVRELEAERARRAGKAAPDVPVQANVHTMHNNEKTPRVLS